MLNEDISVGIEQANGSLIVRLVGELDMLTSPEVGSMLDSLDPCQQIVIDCADVASIDSSGVNMLIDEWRRVNQSGGSLVLRHPSFPVHHVIELTGFIQLLEPDTGPMHGAPTTDRGRRVARSLNVRSRPALHRNDVGLSSDLEHDIPTPPGSRQPGTTREGPPGGIHEHRAGPSRAAATAQSAR